MRDDFMSMVSHELRTPLNTLFLETAGAQAYWRGATPSRSRRRSFKDMVERDQRQIQSMCA